MRIGDIMTRDVRCVEPDTPIIQAAQKMRDLNVGALPVCEEGRLVGVITDRDIAVRGVAMRKSPDRTEVCKLMSAGVASCREDDDLETAAKIMERDGVRRLVVVDAERRVTGIVSIDDIACRAREEHLAGRVLHKIAGEDQAATLH